MFFTQEDYKKIEKWLLANSIKDTQFAGANTPLKGTETIALVQNGKNVKVSLNGLIDQIFLLGVSDFLNVTDKYGESIISLTQAIQLIPFKSRKIGQVITFLDENGNWVIYQFQGKRLNQWNNTSLWINLIKQIEGISIIDSEDIVTEVNNANQVSLFFADKNYNTTDYSGLGRIYLRKNIQTVVNPNTGITYSTNLLTQEMLNKENTVYIIQYDYSLNYQTVSIPDGCVLQFEGGSFSNGTINFNNSRLNGIPSMNCTYLGKLSSNNKVVLNWFGVNTSLSDNSEIINNILLLCYNSKIKEVELEEGVYNTQSSITLFPFTKLKGKGKDSTIINKVTTKGGEVTDAIVTMIVPSDYSKTYTQGVELQNVSLHGNGNTSYGIYCNVWSPFIQFDTFEIRNVKTGISLYGCWLSKLSNLYIPATEIGIIIQNGSGTTTEFENIYIYGTTIYGIYVSTLGYSVWNNIACDNCSGIVYHFDYSHVVLNGCGSESPGALKVIELGQQSNLQMNNCKMFVNTTSALSTTIDMQSSTKLLLNACNVGNNTTPSLGKFIKMSLDTYCTLDNCNIITSFALPPEFSDSQTSVLTIKNKNKNYSYKASGRLNYLGNYANNSKYSIDNINLPNENDSKIIVLNNGGTPLRDTEGYNRVDSSPANLGDVFLNSYPDLNGIFAYVSLSDKSNNYPLVSKVKAVDTNTRTITVDSLDLGPDGKSKGIQLKTNVNIQFNDSVYTYVEHIISTTQFRVNSLKTGVNVGDTIYVASPKSMGDNRFGKVLFINTGETIDRPISPNAGTTFIDTTLGSVVQYDGTDWRNIDGTLPEKVIII